MELENVNTIGKMIPLILKMVTKKDFPEKEFDFVYGMEEHTKDFKKIKKQFKRLFKR